MKTIKYLFPLLLCAVSIKPLTGKSFRPTSGVQPIPNSVFILPKVDDPKYAQYNTPFWWYQYKNQRVKNVLTIWIDRENRNFVTQKCTLRVELSCVGEKYSRYTQGYTPYIVTGKFVELIFDTAQLAKEKDKVSIVVEDMVSSTWTVNSVTIIPGGVYGTNTVPKLKIENFIEIERTEVFNNPNIPYSACNIIPVLGKKAGVKPYMLFHWDLTAFSTSQINSMEMFEVEYVHVQWNPVAGNSSGIPVSLINVPIDFRNNAVRVQVYKDSFFVPNVWDSGFVLYRVRAIGRDTANPDALLYGMWSLPDVYDYNLTDLFNTSTIGGKLHGKCLLPTDNFHRDMSWILSMSFIEGGNYSTSIAYFDGTMRNRESIVHSNEYNIEIVSQTIYDYLGREALKASPSPVIDSLWLHFRPKFNRNLAGAAYSYVDFDTNYLSTKEISVGSMSSASGANKYFSPQIFPNIQSYFPNNTALQQMHKYLPDAQGWAFSQNEFSQDGTNRVVRTGGIGAAHQLSAYHNSAFQAGHEVWVFEGKPFQEELDMLFGNEVGYQEKYKKILTRDPNGQLSVAYIDPYGRTIATALAGDPANTPSLEPLASSGHITPFNAAFNETRIDIDNHERWIENHFLVVQRDTWKFEYKLPLQSIKLPCDTNLCYNCGYDLTIEIRDINGDLVYGPSNQFVGTFDTASMACQNVAVFTNQTTPITVVLDPGEYKVIKKLALSHQKMDAYKLKFFEQESCHKTYLDFLDEEMAKLGRICPLTCLECETQKLQLSLKMDTLRDLAETQIIDSTTSSEFISTKAALEDIIEVCQLACKNVSPCDALYETMLEDVSPGGQYARYEEYDESGEVITTYANITNSILKEGAGSWTCQKADNTTATKNWRNPGNPNSSTHVYHNEDGSESLIPVDGNNKPDLLAGKNYVIISDKKYIKPQDLANVEDFIGFWRESWARDLVYHHPEYCYYTACKSIEPTYAFDEFMMIENEAMMAKTHGYYNPLRMTGLGSVTYNYVTTNLDYSSYEINPISDPIINHPYYTANGSDFRNYLSQMVLQYKDIQSGLCTDMAAQTIWEIYEKERIAKGLTLSDNTCADDVFWPVLRALYMVAKQKFLYNYYTLDSCPSGGNCKNNVPVSLIKNPRFYQGIGGNLFGSSTDDYIFNKNIFNGISSIYCDKEAVKAKIDLQLVTTCSTECRERAKDWLDKLKECPTIVALNSTQLQALEDKMTTMCQGGCDFSNPYGSINVSPVNQINSNYPYKSLRELLIGENILNPNNENSLCTDLLIDFPYQYGHDYLADNDPMKDTCACSDNKELREHSKKCVTLDSGTVSTDCGCDLADKDLKTQVISMHGVSPSEKCQNCINCDDLETPVRLFLEKYEDSASESSDTLMWQSFLETWLNRELGFNLDYQDYETFAKQCLDTTLASNVSWIELWKWVGIERLVSKMDFMEPGELLHRYQYARNPEKQENTELSQNLDISTSIKAIPRYHWEYNDTRLSNIVASVSDFQAPAPWAVNAITYGDVKCRCEKVLEIERLIAEGKGIDPSTGLPKTRNLMSIEVYGEDIYCTGDPMQAKEVCCKIWRKSTAPCDITIEPKFKSGDRFNNDNEIFYNQNGTYFSTNYTSIWGAWDDCPNPCSDNPLVIDNSDGSLDHCACDSLKKWKTAHAGSPWASTMTFEQYILKIRKFSVKDAAALLEKCEEVFKHGLPKKEGNVIGSWVYGDDWSEVSKENLIQEADYYQLKVPNYIKCEETGGGGGSSGGGTYTYSPCTCCAKVMPCDEMEAFISDYVNNIASSTTEYFFENDNYFISQMNLNQPGMKYPYTATAISLLQRNNLDSGVSWRKDLLKALFDELKFKIYPCWPVTPDGELSSMDWNRLLMKMLKNMRSCYDPNYIDEDKCEGCYKANMSWFNDFKTYVNRIIYKPTPDYLHQTDWYLKSSTNSFYDVPQFYNSAQLYPNSPHPQKLFYSVDLLTYGQRKMQVTITDSMGYEMIYGMELLDDRPWVYWGKLRSITKVIPIKSVNCDNPWQFYLEAEMEIPAYKWGDYPECPNAAPILGINTRCDQKVTILVRMLQGGNMATEVPCLKCARICNQPYQKPVLVDHEDCEGADYHTGINNALKHYGEYIDSLETVFDSLYIDRCFFRTQDTLRAKYNSREYHYTLFYYDQAGNLNKTVPPAGVDIDNESLSANDRLALINYRITKTAKHRLNPVESRGLTYHGIITQYKYNTQNSLIWQNTPDGGVSRSWYDILGRQVLSQTSKQASQTNGLFCYIKYDNLGRIAESGQIEPLTGSPSHENSATSSWLAGFLNVGTTYSRLTEVKYSSFDQPYNQSTRTQSEFILVGGQKYLRNRVAGIYYEDVADGDPESYTHGTLFTYDVHGNAKRVVQDIPYLNNFNASFYSLDYSYDLLSGKVKDFQYNRGKTDQFYHHYRYDKDNRISTVLTSRDSTHWESDAKYFYFLHGALGRTELGELQVQGIDFFHTLSGWVKGTNGSHIDSLSDLGKDGFIPTSGNNFNQYVARDVFSYTLNYFQDDYTSILGGNVQITNTVGSGPQLAFNSLFNGNIAQMNTSLPQSGNLSNRTISNHSIGNAYRYDQLNRIKQHKVFSDLQTTPGVASWKIIPSTGMDQWYESFQYDPNGNITQLLRHGDNLSTLDMDNLNYTYHFSSKSVPAIANWQQLISNKLFHVNDQAATGNYLGDIEDQGALPGTSENYRYDELGNLVHDEKEEIDTIIWNVNGKIKEVIRKSNSLKSDFEVIYDNTGQRLIKIIKPRNGSGRLNESHWTREYYVRDMAGNIHASYKVLSNSFNSENTLNQYRFVSDFTIFGIERLGLLHLDTILDSVSLTHLGYQADGTAQNLEIVIPATILFHWNAGDLELWRGNKSYELTNHLKNVLVTIQDRKLVLSVQNISGIPTVKNYQPFVITVSDYYAFGSAMAGRQFKYGFPLRNGFNGQEYESVLGDYLIFEFRIHDARIGRFLSVDPLQSEYPWNSVFSFAENDVIRAIDLEGLEITFMNLYGQIEIAPDGSTFTYFCPGYYVNGVNFKVDKYSFFRLTEYKSTMKNSDIKHMIQITENDRVSSVKNNGITYYPSFQTSNNSYVRYMSLNGSYFSQGKVYVSNKTGSSPDKKVNFEPIVKVLDATENALTFVEYAVIRNTWYGTTSGISKNVSELKSIGIGRVSNFLGYDYINGRLTSIDLHGNTSKSLKNRINVGKSMVKISDRLGGIGLGFSAAELLINYKSLSPVEKDKGIANLVLDAVMWRGGAWGFVIGGYLKLEVNKEHHDTRPPGISPNQFRSDATYHYFPSYLSQDQKNRLWNPSRNYSYNQGY